MLPPRRLRPRARLETFLAEAQRLSRIGSFSWRVTSDEITWSNELYRLYELDQETTITFEVIRTRVHPEDVSLFEKMVERARNGSNDFQWQYRLLMPDQSIKYLHAVAQAMRVEYRAIVDAGFLVQIDDPFLTELYSYSSLSAGERRYCPGGKRRDPHEDGRDPLLPEFVGPHQEGHAVAGRKGRGRALRSKRWLCR